MLDFDFLWNIYQQRQLHDLGSRNAAAHAEALQAGHQVSTLEQRYERLRIVSLAIWALLKQRLSLTDDDLAKQLQAICAGDDGHSAASGPDPRTAQCGKCGHTILSNAAVCMYCGAHNERAQAFAGT